MTDSYNSWLINNCSMTQHNALATILGLKPTYNALVHRIHTVSFLLLIVDITTAPAHPPNIAS